MRIRLPALCVTVPERLDGAHGTCDGEHLSGRQQGLSGFDKTLPVQFTASAGH